MEGVQKLAYNQAIADVKERREEREESLALVLAPSLARKQIYLWAQIEVYVRKSKKDHIIIKKINGKAKFDL